MTNLCLPGRIMGLSIDSIYRGTIYEQTVRIRLDDGEYIQLFDGTSAVDSKLLGEHVKTTSLILPRAGIETKNSTGPGIHSIEDAPSDWAYEFCGEVVAVDPADEWFADSRQGLVILDIGVGTVLIDPNEGICDQIQEGSVSIGDQVCVEALRTDIIEASVEHCD